MSADDDDAWRPRYIDPLWHVTFRTRALLYPWRPQEVQRVADFAETMYLRTGNPLYPMHVWTIFRAHDRDPPAWVKQHIDDIFKRAWDLLDKDLGRTPPSTEIAKAFGLGPKTRHYAGLGDPSDELVGFAVMRQICKNEKVENAIKSAASVFKLSEREVWRIYDWYKKLPGISPDAPLTRNPDNLS
jgi:hypothetical protein